MRGPTPAGDDPLYASHGREGSPSVFLALARRLLETGRPGAAATALDRAYGLDPSDPVVAGERRALLDRLAVEEHGLRFRYVPAGTFLMGSASGDPDEQPVHPVRLGAYWLSETPVSWAAFCRLIGYTPPPEGSPPADPARRPGEFDRELFTFQQENKIRLQYCEDRTTRARDWHAHVPLREAPAPVAGKGWQAPAAQAPPRSRSLMQHLKGLFGQAPTPPPPPPPPAAPRRNPFGTPDREDPEAPWGYDLKPMVAVSWEAAEDLGRRLSNATAHYRLPTEAEWEKGARGGLIDAPYPWGDAPPDDARCDFDRFDRFAIRPMRAFPPNGYGLYAMSGGVWEWTADWYDATAYRSGPATDPTGPAEGKARVLRGGSWADCAEAVTVSFRMAIEGNRHLAPNVGFRLCRIEAGG